MPQKVLVITGPTASGKTKLGIELAKIYDGADSMQIYEHMDIGTAKPTEEEREGIPHHLIGYVSPFENYSVSRYTEDAANVVDDILARNKLPIIVGGTGLYIESLISGRGYLTEGGGSEAREKYSAMYDEVGGDEMLRRLSAFDPVSSEKLHGNDKKRIVRAFEVYELTGKTISSHNEDTKRLPPRYDALKIALSYKNREDLYSRINARVDMMLKAGLLDEVSSLLDMGLDMRYTSMQAIGYKELTSYFEGRCSLEEAVDTIKTESRRYAKRQLSWLRRDSDINWILWDNPPDFESGILDSTNFLGNFGIIKPYT